MIWDRWYRRLEMAAFVTLVGSVIALLVVPAVLLAVTVLQEWLDA